ncbi:MAG: iron-sulfur cluster carrier protein ApbC [Rhodospirillaceae bacterium]|nr:iron-sulfur cluster carrier protein ApbC [Rhodospirillaceae bacterium]MBT4218946.1 iron-sulfur cluster carrier protein ApbC [Rhodospirillaceae bacterium]MBT4464987.1 iron-sulfur cluster carrier protein ApbC [Rhodospirillaceae bacterium]MBT5014500.1 iron-sulfur cluster carrier protein ApbC [Rhodospirillaceae bacterium]MBT5308670.1 iron-sulfur cluster carrier protein ApbC [Rhodospirillaceae bacterium]
MSAISEEQILDALAGVMDGDTNIVAKGMVSGLQIKDGHVAFAIEVDAERGPQMEPLRKQAEKTVHDLDGVLSATVVLTAEASSANSAPVHNQDQHDHHPAGTGPDAIMMPGVKSIVAVASGKGGVGKSTTSVNLALALAVDGHKVGILDADIYGPSIPRMLGVTGEPSSSDGTTLDPMEAHGVKCMSMGFLIEEETPVIWRGPMAQTALQQMMRDINWGDLDILVVDMPPGTGDVQLTMAQQVPLTGAVIVSTPQDIALADARRGLNMFRKVDVPVFGIVENMSYFACPHCGERSEIFSHGGAKAEAELLSVDFLGDIPLAIEIRETSDGGHPIVLSNPDSEHAKAYRAIAAEVWGKTQKALEKGEAEAPRIVVQ